MDDDTIRRAITRGHPDDAGYRAIDVPTLVGHQTPHVRWMATGLTTATVGILAIVLAIAARSVLLGPRSDVAALPPSVVAAGHLNLVVTSGSPQVFIPGGSYEGFDVDVARRLGERLGIEVRIDTADTATLDAGGWGDRWDVALDSGLAANGQASALVSTPYYWRSAAVIVPDGSDISGAGALAGRTLCVLDRSLAGAWLAGDLDLREGSALPAPGGVRVLAMPTDSGCLDAVRNGDADGFVADWAFAVGDPGEGLSLAPITPFTAAAVMSIDPQRPESAALLAAVNAAIAKMQQDATLRTLSLQRFGSDLSSPPSR
ncbi:MAG TPA: transporter substrate-binding domain-containing protein [Candidatus Limnocylindrales bacterium]|nr:transporter substrate-binding domain-containing protein [Candidatus Limnocylindrales bacterium]